MKFHPMHCPQCGEPARGTLDSIPGVAEFTEPAASGEVEYCGSTDVWWDEQKTERDVQGHFHLICHEGHDWWARGVAVPDVPKDLTHGNGLYGLD